MKDMWRYFIPLLITTVILISGCGGPEPEPIKPPAKPTPTSTPSVNGSEWSYRLQGNITPSESCGNLSHYQVKLTLHYTGGPSTGSDVYLNNSSQKDFGDIRFTEADGETLLGHWIQDLTPGINATVWVEFDSVPEEGTGFYLYFGNSKVASASDGYDTFLLFNDGRSTRSSAVSGSAFNWSPTGEVLRCVSNGFGFSNFHYRTVIVSDSYVVDAKIRAQDSNVSDNYQQGLGCSYNNPMVRWLENANVWQIRDPYDATDSDPDPTFDAAQWHEYTFVRNGNLWELYVDGDLKVSHNAGDANRCAGMYVFTEAADHWVEFDDFRVRKYCEPEPTLGPWADAAEELAPMATTEPEPTLKPTATAKSISTQTPALTAEIEATPSPTINPE